NDVHANRPNGKKPSLTSRLLAKKSSNKLNRFPNKTQKKPSGNIPQQKCASCLMNGVAFKRQGRACREPPKKRCGSGSDLPGIRLKKIGVPFSPNWTRRTLKPRRLKKTSSHELRHFKTPLIGAPPL